MIRPATPNDALAIATIHVRAWQSAYDGVFPPEFLERLSIEHRTEFWQRELSEDRSIVLVAEKEGSVAGWISGGYSRDADALGVSEVYAVYVQPALWRHGIGRQLMGSIEKRFPAATDVTLWVLDKNRRAIDFYQKEIRSNRRREFRRSAAPEKTAQQRARANDHSRHASCYRTYFGMKLSTRNPNVAQVAPAVVVAHL